MKKLRWQLMIIFLTGLVVGVLLLSEQQGSPFQLIQPEPAQGGIYTEALVGSPQRFNPLLAYQNSVDRDVNHLLFSGLIKFDEHGYPQGDLAESWGISEDGTIYNIALRKDIKWHDGQPFTSQDVLFTLDLLRQGGAAIPEDLTAFWQNVESVALGDNGIQFRLKEAFAPFMDYLTFGVLPKHILDGVSYDELVDHAFNLQPIGTGPYQFDHLISEDGEIRGVVLKSFDGYFGKKPFIQQFVFRYYADSQAAFQAYQEGTVQGISEITADILPQALAEKDLSLYTGRKPQLTMILLNLKNDDVKFLQDASVRRALLMGINRQGLVDTVLQGQGILANGPIFPGTWAYYDGISQVEYNPEQANKMLAEAGYVLSGEGATIRTNKDNLALKLTLTYPDDDLHQQMAESIKKNWAKIGVETELDPQPYEAILADKLEPRAYQAALVEIDLAEYPDPDPYPFWDMGMASSGQNYSQWENRMVSEYLEQARISTDQAERIRLYHNFQVVFSQELPSLPILYPVYTYGVNREVQGVRMGPLLDSSDRFTTVQEWYLVSKKVSATATPNP